MIRRYKYSLIISGIILYLSLKSGDDFNKVRILNIPHIDKIAHLVMYFTLMTAILLENQDLSKRKNALLTASLIPFLYGIVIEFLQLLVTSTRTGSVTDVLFNALGIVVAIAVWNMIIKKPENPRL